MAEWTWTVPATVVRVIDGDAIVVTLDLGWRVYRNEEHIRVAGINTPEIRGPEREQAYARRRSIVRSGARRALRQERLTPPPHPCDEGVAPRLAIHARRGPRAGETTPGEHFTASKARATFACTDFA
jgi:hypothetical protein